MLDDVLAAFPPHTHPLTLVSDPDDVLADEVLRAELANRGFRLITDDGDPIALRHGVRQVTPFTAASPLVIVTRRPLNALPYDLWQQGRHVTLDLAALFLGLDAGVVRMLSPSQRRRLDAAVNATPSAPHPTRSRRETIAYVLAHGFGFTTDGDMLTPAGALTWLARYHAAGGDPLPHVLAEEVRTRLQRAPALRGWPLETLLTDAAAFRRFVQHSWEAYLAEHAAIPGSLATKESRAAYGTAAAVPFATDDRLQDALPSLVRSGALPPEPVADAAKLPAWAQLAIVPADAELQVGRLAASLDELERLLAEAPANWDDWSHVAWTWAALAEPLRDPRLTFPTALTAQRDRVQDALDTAFLSWLSANYALLAGRSLPRPHHLFHIPQWLADGRERRPGERVALVVLDGMSLSDWLQIRAAWAARHPDWTVAEAAVLAEAPSITAISRLALIAGQRPNAFAAGELQNRHEPGLWRNFWSGRGLPPDAAFYVHLSDGADCPHEISSHRTQAICLVSTAVDDMVHGATLGAAEVLASLDVWLAGNGVGAAAGTNGPRRGSAWLEYLIERLLEEGYTVSITSDHGHVEAVGMGVPSEGVIAATRGKRARLYSSADLARSRHAATPDTLLLEDGWLPPADVYPLVAADRKAFAPSGERVVTHGGLTIEEMIVPLVTIEKR